MFKRKVIALVLMLLIASPSAFASYSKSDVKGASSSAMEHASDESIFNRVGDWFATVGKSPEEKKMIIMKRKAERAAKKMKKAASKKMDDMKKKFGN